MQKENKLKNDIKKIISTKFKSKFVNNLLDHFDKAIQSLEEFNDDEKTILRSGKFVEALTKILLEYTNQSIPSKRDFRAGNLLDSFIKLPKNRYSETIRITIPRLAIFLYDVANNRGGRHDSYDVDVNKVDALFLLEGISWIMTELLRYSVDNNIGPEEANFLLKSIYKKRISYFEEIGERVYINLPKKIFKKLSCKDVGILILYYKYPRRVTEEKLFINLKKHDFEKDNIVKSIQRLKFLTDEDKNGLLLRGSGREEAEAILSKISKL